MNENNSTSTQEHQRYFELCALATTGTLTDQEWNELKRHLTDCVRCDKRVQEYREIARTGMATLMPDNNTATDSSFIGQPEMEKSWSSEIAKTELFTRIARDHVAPQHRLGSHAESQPGRRTLSTKLWTKLWNREWQLRPQYALLAIVVALIAVSAYRFGTTRARDLANTQSRSSSLIASSWRTELDRLKLERAVLAANLQSQTLQLHDVSEELELRAAEVEKWKAVQSKTVEQLQQRTSEIGTLQAHQIAAEAQRDAIDRKLQESQAALQTIQQKYDTLRDQNAAQLVRTASLETRIDDLSVRLKEADSTVQQHERFLASDRDIRDLMGARELYIADVFDVDQNGKTQKPFGRAFYTRGKSLIFYAFDLDQQPHLRNASTFQAWGRRGLNDKPPLNMGIFYLDNETNKRWVLKFDDPEALAQIDAVFVTIEPRGGSQKPSGKQLLFASLRSVPNHP
jgi:hypothetical protein